MYTKWAYPCNYHLNQRTKYNQHPRWHFAFPSLTSNNEYITLVDLTGKKHEIQRGNPRSQNYWTRYLSIREHCGLVSCPVIWPMATSSPVLFACKYLFFFKKKKKKSAKVLNRVCLIEFLSVWNVLQYLCHSLTLLMQICGQLSPQRPQYIKLHDLLLSVYVLKLNFPS